MRRKLNDIYRDVAREFTHRVTSVLGDQVESIVLYGSVARGEAKRDSDIDIFIVSQDSGVAQDKVSRICSDFTYERNFAFFISLVQFSREEFYELKRLGSPFIDNVIDEGVMLYDNGTFSTVHQKTVAAS